MRRLLAPSTVTTLVALLACDMSACDTLDTGERMHAADASPRRALGDAACTVDAGRIADAGRDTTDAVTRSRDPTDATLDDAPSDACPTDAVATVDAGARRADAGAPDAGGNDVIFAPYPGLDPGGLARPIGSDFAVSPWWGALRTSPEGRSWLLWTSYSTPDLLSKTLHLDHFDVDGRQIGSSPLAVLEPEGFVLHESGSLTTWRNQCQGTSTPCLDREDGGTITERLWPPALRTVRTWQLDWNGDIASSSDVDMERRFIASAAAAADGLYVLTGEGDTRVHYLDGAGAPVWSVEVFPRVLAPILSPDAPLGDAVRALYLTLQSKAELVAVNGGVVIAAIVTRGTLAALAAGSGPILPAPDDPVCGDVVVVRVSADGQALQYWSVPTAQCEDGTPELAVVDEHAVVASSIRVAIPPAPNDTFQYDISLAILDLSTGAAVHTTIGMSEDDFVDAMAPCGTGAACLAGTTGARSVDTGSTLTYGDGFILPVSLDGSLGTRWNLHSDRHTTIPRLAPRSDGSVLFFATVDGPITHTADADPSLRYNAGLLGIVTGAQ